MDLCEEVIDNENAEEVVGDEYGYDEYEDEDYADEDYADPDLFDNPEWRNYEEQRLNGYSNDDEYQVTLPEDYEDDFEAYDESRELEDAYWAMQDEFRDNGNTEDVDYLEEFRERCDFAEVSADVARKYVKRRKQDAFDMMRDTERILESGHLSEDETPDMLIGWDYLRGDGDIFGKYNYIRECSEGEFSDFELRPNSRIIVKNMDLFTACKGAKQTMVVIKPHIKSENIKDFRINDYTNLERCSTIRLALSHGVKFSLNRRKGVYVGAIVPYVEIFRNLDGSFLDRPDVVAVAAVNEPECANQDADTLCGEQINIEKHLRAIFYKAIDERLRNVIIGDWCCDDEGWAGVMCGIYKKLLFDEHLKDAFDSVTFCNTNSRICDMLKKALAVNVPIKQ